MKKILITGANSYIGTSFEKWMEQFSDDYQIDTIDMKDDKWQDSDFSEYDSIFHVAGIAHADVSKVNEQMKKKYYQVNCDLAVETAKKYKNDLNGKIGQFIYMSSIIIYGEDTNLKKMRVISSDTKPAPTSFYGDSKLQAELNLQPLKTDSFRITILRPPMVYGYESKGNFSQLVKIACRAPVFPNINNQRSMLFIVNLCMYLKVLIDNSKSGIFFPQNNEYIQTSQMVSDIANYKNKKIVLTSFFNWAIKLLAHSSGRVGKLINKAFGNLVYEKQDDLKYFISTKESIKLSLGEKSNE